MKTNNISSNLLDGLENEIIYRRSAKTFVNTAIYLAIALCATIIMATGTISQESSLYFLSGLVAAAGYMGALLSFIFSKKEIRYAANNQKLEGRVYHIDATPTDIMNAIDTGDCNFLRSKANDNDRGIKVEMVSTEDCSVARCCLYKFVPFEYQPVSGIVDLKQEQATKIKTIL